MSLISCVLLAVASSLIIQAVVLGYHHTLIHKVNHLYKRATVLSVMAKLRRSGYFDLTPPHELRYCREKLKETFMHADGIRVLYGSMSDYDFDYRNFIIEYDIDCQCILLNFQKFEKACEVLSLKVVFGSATEVGDDISELDININGNKYLIRSTIYHDSDYVLDEFVRILNHELAAAQYQERAYLAGSYPFHLLLLNERLKKHILG